MMESRHRVWTQRWRALQHFALDRVDKLMERRKVAAHVSFAVKLCVMQSKSGRKFMIEQPVGTRDWGTQLMNKLLFEESVGKVNFDFDMFEMKSAKEREVRLARKRTSIISKTASQHMAQPSVCDWAKIKRIAKVCVAGKTYTNHNVRRLRLGG